MRFLFRGFLVTIVIGTSLLTACSEKQAETQPSTALAATVQAEVPTAGGIPWFEGSVEEAFAAAASQQKPVFLYWGAQWCPPCHELKATIFQRDEFIAQSKLFVPLYLDGDTDRAQQYGEKFGVFGYPTVIIFDPRGVEITRIPGGMDIERYVSVLELALNALQPVSELLRTVQGGEPIRDDDWRLLASYAWGQDRGRAIGEQQAADVLAQLAQACPARLAREKSQLQMLAIDEWADAKERDPTLAPTYLTLVQKVLADTGLSRANLNSFIYGGANLIKALTEGEDQLVLRDMMLVPLLAAIEDPQVNALTRIEALFGWVDVNMAVLPEEEKLTAEQQAWVKARVEATRAELNSFQQHTALSTISQLYYELGLDGDARTSALEGMEVSKQPYYFMSIMGHLERESGNDSEALQWYRLAWDASEGPATRVQWGAKYLYALTSLSPDDLDTIRETGSTVVAELAAQQDGLHHRNSVGMDRLSERMLAWAIPAEGDSTTALQREVVLSSLRGEMGQLCDRMDMTGDAARTCENFLIKVEQDEGQES